MFSILSRVSVGKKSVCVDYDDDEDPQTFSAVFFLSVVLQEDATDLSFELEFSKDLCPVPFLGLVGFVTNWVVCADGAFSLVTVGFCMFSKLFSTAVLSKFDRGFCGGKRS